MFFVLSKLFWFLIQPVNLAIILLIAGLLLAMLRWHRTAYGLFGIAALGLALCVWTSFGALLVTPLEDRFPRPPLPEKVAGIVVLGGGFEGGINLVRGGYELNSGGDRYVEAAALARRYPEATIVISGGTGALLLEGEDDASTAVRLFEALGIPRERLVLEGKSRNTYENAVFTKELVTPAPGETWLLVTSAFHMPRSMALFRQAGFPVTPWPVDYRTTGREGIGFFVDNPVDSLQTATLGIREWIGLIAYWLTGRIDQPFPSP
ncbi:YdcF family protein [Mesorhizobium sp. J428]|uniref:YdcF family protein n=1 Tax=Mesorhizobium sp. J428 TaxID=2898440 RepID=UPI002150F79E|nr:YdcF family protein [Mesorhizobium sp. J428]MCR5859326.1 YdcF family protein [Mesorhizobium sp. J428]